MQEKPHSSPLFGVHTAQLPPALDAASTIPVLALRPFGIDERDLDVDFNQVSRPALVTDILERCATVAGGHPPDRNLFWELQVNARIECLLRIVDMGGAFETALPMKCLNEACGEKVEVDLSLDELLGSPGERSDLISVECGAQTLEVRRPRGSDQRTWAAQEFESDQAAIEAMVQTLVVQRTDSGLGDRRASLDADSLSAIDQAMRESDSLVNFSFEVVCPYCQSHSEFDLDLEALSLGRLRHNQQSLLAMVHRLARQYHWSERQIFAVPHWRRLHYLRLLEEERT